MEKCFINCKKPQMAVKEYMKAQRLQDAMRVAKKHCPKLVSELSNPQLNHQKQLQMSLPEKISQAKMWEQSSEWEKAVDLYLDIDYQEMTDQG